MSKEAVIFIANATNSLVALNAGPLQIPAGENGAERVLPVRVLAMPWGSTATNKGTLIVNEVTLSALPRNQALAKFDRVAFDFNHATVNPAPADEPIKVAGYGTPEIVAGEGIYLSAIEYTEDGKAALLGGHYPDISPTLHVNAKGEVIFMHSLAAVRQGEVDGLTLFSPANGSKAAVALKALSASSAAVMGEEPDYRAIAILALNSAGAALRDDADGADILSAAAALRDSDSPTPDKPITMSADLKTLTDRLDAVEKSNLVNRRAVILSAAKAQGKVIPLSAERIAATDPEILEEMVAALPAGQVPLESDNGDETDSAVSLSAGGNAPLTALENEVCRQLNLSADDYKKFGKAV